MRQVHVDAVEVVRPERAARAALVPVGAEHEVIDHELAAAGEQVAERDAGLRRLEDIVLLDLHPRQLAALARELVAQRVNSFSLASCALLASSHSDCETMRWLVMLPSAERFRACRTSRPTLVVGLQVRLIGERTMR